MATVINPENSTITTSKDEISQVPECVFWLPCDETGAITTLTDAVSGGTVTIPSSTASSGGVIIPNVNSAAYSGTLPALSGDFALICLVEMGDIVASVGYGSGVERINMGSASTTVVGASGTDTLDAVPASTLSKVLLYVSTTGDSYLYASEVGSALVNTLNPASATGIITPSVDEMVFQALGGNTTMYGLALLDLSANNVPSDIVVWADWTMEQWAVNNKVLPARFKEL